MKYHFNAEFVLTKSYKNPTRSGYSNFFLSMFSHSKMLDLTLTMSSSYEINFHINFFGHHFSSFIYMSYSQFSSVQSLSHVWLLQPHEPQHARPPCSSATPRVHPNPCPLSRRCHPINIQGISKYNHILQYWE